MSCWYKFYGLSLRSLNQTVGLERARSIPCKMRELLFNDSMIKLRCPYLCSYLLAVVQISTSARTWRGSARTATAGTSRAATSVFASRATDWPPPGTPASVSSVFPLDSLRNIWGLSWENNWFSATKSIEARISLYTLCTTCCNCSRSLANFGLHLYFNDTHLGLI